MSSELLTRPVAEPFFLGTSFHRLDPKNRVHVPQRIRQPDKRSRGDSGGVVFERFFLIPWEEDGCVFLLTDQQFQRMASEVPVNALGGEGARKDRDDQRDFFSKVEFVELDGQGRITLPQAVMDFLFPKGSEGKDEDGPREVALVGAGLRAEIWNAAQRR